MDTTAFEQSRREAGKMKNNSTRELTLAAMVAALYVVLGYFGNVFGLTFGVVQFRFAEALCVLPILFPAAVPGLFVGCLITNLLSPYGLLDMVCGSLATLLAALWTARLNRRWLAPLPAVLCNGVVVGFVLAFSQTETGFSATFPAAWLYNGLTVALGELGVCATLGMLLLYTLPRMETFRSLMPPARRERWK